MKTLKNILMTLLGLLVAIFTFKSLKKDDKNEQVIDEVATISNTIATNNVTIQNEEQKREEIRKETDAKKNEDVTNNDLVDFFNARK